MPDMFEPDASALAALLSKPRVVTRCESCKAPLNDQTGECKCSA
ncbi:hypothetical protein [Arthrobacter silvisoli]|nr:hypothetical protein [Arthrobacter silvisoli]